MLRHIVAFAALALCAVAVPAAAIGPPGVHSAAVNTMIDTHLLAVALTAPSAIPARSTTSSLDIGRADLLNHEPIAGNSGQALRAAPRVDPG